MRTTDPVRNFENAIAHFRTLLEGRLQRHPTVYFVDLLLSGTVGWGAFALSCRTENLVGKIPLLILAACGFFRAASFTHELAHMTPAHLQGEFRVFYAFWHAFVGVPTFLPHFFYRDVHTLHHGQRTYGSERDGEYLPLMHLSPVGWAKPLLETFLHPLLGLFRFTVLSALGVCFRKFRKTLYAKYSVFALRFPFERPEPLSRFSQKDARVWEPACSLFAWSVVLLVAAWPRTFLPIVAHYYVLLVVTALLDVTRSLVGTHRYQFRGEEALDREAIFMDSLNTPSGSLLVLALFPVGLRFHALHHLFPTLPYHALGKAHAALCADARYGKLYGQATVRSPWHSFRALARARLLPTPCRGDALRGSRQITESVPSSRRQHG